MLNQSVRIARPLTCRDIGQIADTAEKLGGVYVRKDGRTVPASNFIGLLSLCLKPGDTVEILNNGGEDAGMFAALLNNKEETHHDEL